MYTHGTTMLLRLSTAYACGFGKRLDRYLDLMRAPPDVRMLTGICRVYMLYSKSDSSYCSLLSNVVPRGVQRWLTIISFPGITHSSKLKEGLNPNLNCRFEHQHVVDIAQETRSRSPPSGFQYRSTSNGGDRTLVSVQFQHHDALVWKDVLLGRLFEHCPCKAFPPSGGFGAGRDCRNLGLYESYQMYSGTCQCSRNFIIYQILKGHTCSKTSYPRR